jgi:O-antigen/teichoic acid export membrane protein
VGLVPIAVSAAADPMIARLYAAGDQARLQRLASVVVRWSTGMASLTVVFFGLAGPLVLTLFGSEFVDAYGVLLILAGGQVGYAGVGLAAGLLNLTGHQQEGMVIFGGGAVLNIVLNAAGLALWDSQGAALATAMAVVVTGLALWYRARINVGVDASVVYALRRHRPG